MNALVKAKEAIVLKLLDEIEVEALPTDLPREFVVDASKLAAVGDEIKVKDLDYDRAKVEITNHSDEDPVVLLDKIEEIKEEEAPVSEEEALAKVTATEELSEEEKAKRALEKEEKPEKVKK